MIPVYLDPSAVRIALIGRERLAERRLAWLKEGGSAPDVWSDDPSGALAAAANKLLARLPDAAELKRYHIVWIADLPRARAEALALRAREAGVLVNVEDVPSLCDFHSPAVTRRGKLTLAAGTGGASPAVSRAARERLEAAFSDTWGEALNEIAEARASLRSEGAGFDALVADARARLAHHGLA